MYKSHEPVIMALSVDTFAIFLCLLPLVSFLSCAVVALVLHFDSTTRTHCKVSNYLPSISAAIGGHMPEKFIWRVGIALHCLPRIFLIPYSLHKYFKNTITGRKYNSTTWWFWLLNLAAAVSHLVENGALITLTYVSSTEHFGVHEGSFIIFMVCSMLFMLLWCILFRLTATQPMAVEEYRLFKRNLCTLSLNFCSFGLAVYFFFRHNWYCEPGVYTLFAFCEYITVVSNIAFHWHCSWVFTGTKLTFGYYEDSLLPKKN